MSTIALFCMAFSLGAVFMAGWIYMCKQREQRELTRDQMAFLDALFGEDTEN